MTGCGRCWGAWVGDGGEGAKGWGAVRTELKNRGVADICIPIRDGRTRLPEAVNRVWPKTVVQTCIVHLIRNGYKYASRADCAAIAKDPRPIYTAATEAAALDRLADFAAAWEDEYPAIIRLWERAWSEFVPFSSFDR